MKSQDLQIEELTVSDGLVQGWGKIINRPFQFRAKHGSWEFAVFEDESLEPWDIDLPGEDHAGMYIIQRQKQDVMTRADADRTITRCADAYLFMIGRRQSDL
ncbi:MAG TPA: hypothetical protein VGL61_32405 [Kofleriaceae bacterium]|jgi:hypothetical protein